MSEVIPFPSDWPADFFWAGDLPQPKPVSDRAFGAGWPELDEILKFYRGQFVVVTGTAGSGKSTFLLNVLCKMAREQGIKSFLYVPENEGNLLDKLRRIWNVRDEKEEHGFKFYMDCYFGVLSAQCTTEAKTLAWILDRAEWAVMRQGLGVVMIDPWNEIERLKPRDMALTDYIGECIQMIKESCRSAGYTAIMVAHPTKAVSENGGRIPGLYDIEGSANWYNKCDNGLIVVRDPERNKCRVISAKVREIGAGRLGQAFFDVDPNTGIFTPEYGGVTL